MASSRYATPSSQLGELPRLEKKFMGSSTCPNGPQANGCSTPENPYKTRAPGSGRKREDIVTAVGDISAKIQKKVSGVAL